jgi:hypothetical protein
MFSKKSSPCDDELDDAVSFPSSLTHNRLLEKLLARPVLVVAVGKVSSDNQGDLLLAQLLDGDLKRVRLTL